MKRDNIPFHPMIKILQINVDGGRVAQDLMEAKIKELDIDVLIISEQYKNKTEEDGWFRDNSGKAAVAVINEDLPIMATGSPDDIGFRWVEVKDHRIYACYWSPNMDTDSFERFLDNLEASVRSAILPVIIAGDLNAKSGEWGDHREDVRGRLLTDLMSSLNLLACNCGNTPTFERIYRDGRVSQSSIDVTLVSEISGRLINGWRVLDEYTGSLHRYITFTIETITYKPTNQDVHQQGGRWSWRKYDQQKLQKFLDEKQFPFTNIDALDKAPMLDNLLKQACDASMPKGTYKGNKRPAYWWTEKIADLKKECHAARRKSKRNRQRNQLAQQTENLQKYKDARTKLKREIRRSKRECWEKLCRQVEEDPWGLPYRLVTKKLVRRKNIPEITLPGRLEAIVDGLFPRHELRNSPQQSGNHSFPEITIAEIKVRAAKIPLGKAPGPDGVPDLIIKEIVKSKPEILINVFNSCLAHGIFPGKWKVAKLVLLRKGTKPLDMPSSYRPISLLNTIGKLFERVIKGRLEDHLIGEYELNDHQYGFRKGRSTTDAISTVMNVVHEATVGQYRRRKMCAVVAIDVANAFNSAKWIKIMEALRKKNVPEYLMGVIGNYLNDRWLEYGEGKRRLISCGVPQGSVLGPLLWNIMYDDLLRLNINEKVLGPFSCTLVGFADDVAVVTAGQTTEILEAATNEALRAVSRWLDENGLTLSKNKTEAVILTTKRAYEKPRLQIDGTPIQVKEQLRYLGVELSQILGYRKHIEKASAKAVSTASSLARLMPNIGGATQLKRKLLATVVHSQLLYAAPIWANALEYEINVKTILRPQRTIALRVAMAYRTVSTQAIVVVAGFLPAHLMARERQRRYRDRIPEEEAREDTYIKWQQEWDTADTGRWTRRLIKDVKKWSTRKHGMVDFHTTQMLTGHGCFGEYLHRFRRLVDPKCVDCLFQRDDAEHAIFHCDRWWSLRRALEVDIGMQFEPDTVVDAMLQSKGKWNTIQKFLNKILSMREEEERKRQQEEAL